MLDHPGSCCSFPNRRSLCVPAIQPYIIEPIWEQFRVLLPERKTNHPLGCHRPRIPDRVVFEKLLEVLVFETPPPNRHDSLLLDETLDRALCGHSESCPIGRACISTEPTTPSPLAGSLRHAP